MNNDKLIVVLLTFCIMVPGVLMLYFSFFNLVWVCEYLLFGVLLFAVMWCELYFVREEEV